MSPVRAAILFLGAALSFFPVLLTAYSGGPPVRRTNAPGDRSCIDANCHQGPRFDDSPAITLDNGGSLVYAPGGGVQRWRIRINDSGVRAYGLQLTVRASRDLRRLPAGDLTAVQDLTSVICEDDQFKGLRPCRAEAPLQFFHHTEARPGNEFLVDWRPPTLPEGDVVAYVAANASVGGQRNARIHHRAFLLRQQDGPAAWNAASQMEGIAAGGWVTVIADGLDAPGLWTARVNGRPAEIAYRSARVMNLQAPAGDPAVGLVYIDLLRDGVPAVEVLAWKRRWAPAFFPASNAALRPGDRASFYVNGLGGDLALRVHGVLVETNRQPVLPGIDQVDFVVPPLRPGVYGVEALSESTPVANPPALVVGTPN
jgi:hypothetical protein